MRSADAPALVWLRQDLRLSDNPALDAAAKSKRPLVLLYLLDDETAGQWRFGGASRWWLHHSLTAFALDAAKRGARLVLRRGAAQSEIPKIVDEIGAGAVFWNRCYEPYAVARDTTLKETLAAEGLEASSFHAALLIEPWAIKTKAGEPFKVFTPFWRAALQSGAFRTPIAAPKKLNGFADAVRSDDLADWALTPARPNWAKGFAPLWTPGEAGAHAALDKFLDDKLAAYPEARDQLGAFGTSRLSPHLRFGEISPFRILATIRHAAGRDTARN